MERLTCILDTNAVADYLNGIGSTTTHIDLALGAGRALVLAQPVYYEVQRGLMKVGATRKLRIFEDAFIPQLQWEALAQVDWQQAAHYWVEATRKGCQLSDMDLLIAAISSRLHGVLISADDDFDVLSIPREDWRNLPQST